MNTAESKFRSRKFILAVLFSVTSCVCVTIGRITGVEFAMVSAAILGIYTKYDVDHKKNMSGSDSIASEILEGRSE